MSYQQKTKNKFNAWNIVILIIVTILSFLIGEYIFRQLALTDRLGFERIQSVEQRALDVPAPNPEVMRVLGVGDSFTVFRDTQGRNYLRYAEKILRQSDTQIEIINLAQAGTGLDDYFKNIVLYSEKIRPDIVTIGLYHGNDVSRPGEFNLKQRFDDGKITLSTEVKKKRIKEVIVDWAKKSILLNFTFRHLKFYLPAFRSGEFKSLVDYLKKQEGRDDSFVQKGLNRADPSMVRLAVSDSINSWDLASAIFHPNHYVNLYGVPHGSRAERNLSRMIVDLDFVISWLRERGIKPIVVLLHPSIIVHKKYQQYYKRLGYALPDPETGTTPLTARIAQYLLSQEIIFLDSLLPLRMTNGTFYIPNDTHLNSEGQRIVGKALYDLLVSYQVLID